MAKSVDTHVVKSVPSKAFVHAGIYVLRSEQIYLLVICHPVGVNRTGPHKHNDWLSFELCVDNQPIVIDPGTYCYTGNIEMRRMFRSTPYHNTVVVDSNEQIPLNNTMFGLNDVVGDVKVLQYKSDANVDILEAEHSGYTRLHRSVIHRRRFLLDKQKQEVEITDTFIGEGDHLFEWYLHLDTDLKSNIENHTVKIYKNQMPIVEITQDVDKNIGIKNGWVSRSYNQRKKSEIIYYCSRKVLKKSIRFTQRYLPFQTNMAFRS